MANAHCWVKYNLVSTRTPSLLPSCFSATWPPVCTTAWDYSPKGIWLCSSLYWNTWHFCGPFSSFLMALWIAAQPSESVSPRPHPPPFYIFHKLAEGALHPFSSVINYEFKQYWPRIRPKGTPLGTSLQLHFMPLIANLWAQQSSQFAIHLTACLSSPYFFILSMWMWWETMSKELLKLR